MPQAILLLSGGLDSTLAGKILLELGLEVEAVNFTSPFCNCTPKGFSCSAAKVAADQIGIPVKTFGCGREYLEVMKHPRFGRGSGMNACLDCRIFIFSRAREYMLERGASFIATGEVLGERPMSQRLQAMQLIEREANLEGLIVRPLCARHLAPSRPEQQGLVDRSRLYDIQGRCRKPQIRLAEELGIRDYPCPAGGCLLTQEDFALKFRDLLEHDPGFGVEDAAQLRRGRHFRLPGGAKVVLGRNEAENNLLEQSARAEDVLLVPCEVPGPSALLRGSGAPEAEAAAAALVALYTKASAPLAVEVRAAGSARRLENVQPLLRETAEEWRIGVREEAAPARTAG